MRRDLPSTAFVALLYLSVLAVAIVRSWALLAVVLFFAVNALFVFARVGVERLLSAPSQGIDTDPPVYLLTGYRPRIIYQSLLHKRGQIGVFGGRFRITVRNIPDALSLHMPIFLSAVLLGSVVVWISLFETPSALIDAAAEVDPLLVGVLFFAVLVHCLVVWTRNKRDVYRSSPSTTLYRTPHVYAIAVPAIVASVGPQRWSLTLPETVVFAGALAVAIELRLAGVGAGILGANQTGTDPVTSIEHHERRPIERFETNRAATRCAGVFYGLVGVVAPMPGVIPLLVVWPPVGLLTGVFTPLPVWLSMVLALLATIAVLVVVQRKAKELAHGAVEYLVYDDAIVAYNTVLAEPQWVLESAQLDDVTVSTDWLAARVHDRPEVVRITTTVDSIPGRQQIDHHTADDAIVVRYLNDPQGFVRAIRGLRS